MRPPLFILAGGQGTRLREITGPDIPKPMVDVCGKPFLYWLIQEMRRQGFEDITISTGYKAEVIEDYPWPWFVKFKRDKDQMGPDLALQHIHYPPTWICNGDTYPLTDLPGSYNGSIGTYNDIDSGCQLIGAHRAGRLRVFRCPFIDIGTPEGLEQFREYAKTHLV